MNGWFLGLLVSTKNKANRLVRYYSCYHNELTLGAQLNEYLYPSFRFTGLMQFFITFNQA
jgi:hypothetical protein